MMMEIISKRCWFLLLCAVLLITGCDSGPFYDNPYCRLEGDQNQLFCQMGKKMPLFRSGDEIQFVDLCQQISEDSGILLTRLFQHIQQEGRFLAIGGYCPVQDVLESTAQAAKLDGVRFDSLLIQLFIDESSNIESVVPDLKSLGANVKVYQLESHQ